MKTLITKWFTDETGPKLFFSDSKRVRIHEFPISKFTEFKKNIEETFEFEGVYVLLGEDEQGKKAYVGEADSIDARLKQHIKDEEKSFTERVLVISSQMLNFPYSKTELHYIEKNLIQKFKESEFIVTNGNSGQGKKPQRIDVLTLDEEMELIFSGIESLGISLDDNVQHTISKNDYINDREPISIYATIPGSKTTLNGTLNPDDSITVHANQEFKSKAKSVPDLQKTAIKALEKHRNLDNIEVQGNFTDYSIKYLTDFSYKSPTAASYLIAGGNVNGWFVWKQTSNKEPISNLRK